MLDPRHIVRWVWLGRAALACAILAAAVFVWDSAEPVDTLVATLAFASAVLTTAASAMYAEVYRRPVGTAFYLLQCLVDLLIVTAIVHITGGWSSQFGALYILVIATGALMLPFQAGLGVAACACAFYAVDVLWLRTSFERTGVGVQLAVFIVVAVGSGFIAARLRQAGVGRDALAAQLVKVQLEAADILRTIRSGIISVDSEGRLLYANPAAADLLNMHLRSLVGRPVLESLGNISPQLAQLLERTVREGIRTTRVEGVIRRDGKDIPIGVTTTIADPAHGSSGMTATAIFQDISDTKRLQALNVRAERLEAVAELSASLAHEIKNPLASIRSATEQLARRHEASKPRLVTSAAQQDADEDERVLHALVMREADRLSRLLSEFLDFAKAQVVQVVALDAGDIVKKAVQLVVAHPDRGSNVQVSVNVMSDSLLMDGDEDLLHRAVFNLTLNAVQAFVVGGGVAARTGHVQVDVRLMPDEPATARTNGIRWDGDTVAISVSDNGPGISEDIRNTLFEPFVTTKNGGSGLGLPIVHRAVEAHHGVVMVDALNPGARFTILLPRNQRQATGTHAVSNVGLLIDDAANTISRITGVAA